MTQVVCERWPMVDKQPVVHDRVWDLLQRMRNSVDHVGRFYGGGELERPALERPLVDRYRRGVYASSRPASYGGADHQAFKDWIAPSAAKRIGQRLRGPDAADKDRNDNFMFRRTMLIDSLECVVGTPNLRDGGMNRTIARAWIASHLDRVIDDLRGSYHLPSDAAELKLGWADADAAQKQQILADLHLRAPIAYAFAEAVGEQVGMSAERTLHVLNNVPPRYTAETAAGLLMDQAVPRYERADVTRDKATAIPLEKVAVRIEIGFEDATPGRRIVELAMERIDELKQPAARTEPELPRDPRIGISTPGSPGSGAGQGASGPPKQPKGPGKTLGMG
jgi:hypothetical protein